MTRTAGAVGGRCHRWRHQRLLADLEDTNTMVSMRIRQIFAVAAVSALAFTACSNDDQADDAEPPVETPDDDVETPVDTPDSSDDDGDEPADEAVVPPTIAPGSQVALGELDSVRQDLDPACESAIGPIRDLTDTYASGLEMGDDDRETFNAALANGFGACDTDDWERFQQLELRGWMNAVPGS